MYVHIDIDGNDDEGTLINARSVSQFISVLVALGRCVCPCVCGF